MSMGDRDTNESESHVAQLRSGWSEQNAEDYNMDQAGYPWRHAEQLGAVAFDAPHIEIPMPDGFEVWSAPKAPSLSRVRVELEEDLEAGVNGVWLTLGSKGTRTLTAGDFAVALDGLDFNKTSVQLEADDPLTQAACLIAYARWRRVDALTGGFGADPLGTFLRNGKLLGGLHGALFELESTAHLSLTSPLSNGPEGPSMRPALVRGGILEEAGASPITEIAWTLATTFEYFRHIAPIYARANLSPSDAFAGIGHSTALDSRFIENIAKLRALRLCLLKLASTLGAEDPRLSIRARSSEASRGKTQPTLNLLRGTAESFAAIVGGADIVTCSPFDSRYPSNTNRSRRLARNTPWLLRDESRLGHVSDPAAGSYLIDALTDHLARGAWASFQDIQQHGGAIPALLKGQLHSEIATNAEVTLEKVAAWSRKYIGITRFTNSSEAELKRPSPDLRAIEGELGEPLGNLRGKHIEREDALLALANAALDDDAQGAADSALLAIKLGADVEYARRELLSSFPSGYCRPLSIQSPFIEWETLAASVKQKIADVGPPSIRIVAFGSEPEYQQALSFAKDLLGAVSIDPPTTHLAKTGLSRELHDTKPSPLVLLVGSSEHHQRMGGFASELDLPTGALVTTSKAHKEPLAEFADVHLQTSGPEVLGALRKLLTLMGLVRNTDR